VRCGAPSDGVCGVAPPPSSYIVWRQAVAEGIFLSTLPHRPPLIQYCQHTKDGPEGCWGGAATPRARARLGWPPSAPSSCHRLTSGSGSSWHGGLSLVWSWFGLLLHLCHFMHSRKRTVWCISLVLGAISCRVTILPVQVEFG
jgi:hypothetical protein